MRTPPGGSGGPNDTLLPAESLILAPERCPLAAAVAASMVQSATIATLPR
jgi:hypothetical protein